MVLQSCARYKMEKRVVLRIEGSRYFPSSLLDMWARKNG